MNIFISWSGNRSKAVAELLCDWIKCVLQATKPWLSLRDIDRGALWFDQIQTQLKDTSVGIICLTQENKDKPWILFEAGALAKGISSNRVCTFLVDLTPTDIRDPLAQFNHTVFTKESLSYLVATINAQLGNEKLEDRILSKVFENYWPDFEARFNETLKLNPATEEVKHRDGDDILLEILESTRSLNRRMQALESTSGAVSRRGENPETGNSVKLKSVNVPSPGQLSQGDLARLTKKLSDAIANHARTVEGNPPPQGGGMF